MYEVLADLARPWTMPVGLVHGQGNFGSRGDDPPAGSRYTEARISPAGRVALAAERGQIAAVPIGVINGNTYRGGLRPPFRPDAIIAAAREIIRRPEVTSKELAGIACQLHFLTGCTVSGDLAALAAGRQVELRLQAQVSISGDRAAVIIENIPPNISIDETARIIASRASAPRWVTCEPVLSLSGYEDVVVLDIPSAAAVPVMASLAFGIYLRATPQRVGEALADPALVPGWLSGVWSGPAGEEDPRRLTCEWLLADYLEINGGCASVARFDLVAMGQVTRLTVNHRGLDPGGSLLRALTPGWPMILSSLKSLVETGEPLEFRLSA